MKVLVDMGVGTKVARVLVQAGHDVKTVRELDRTMPDDEILALATRESRVVVTMDKDFGELVFREKQPHAGVLLLRAEASNGTEKARIVSEIVAAHAPALPGKFAVFKNGRVRLF